MSRTWNRYASAVKAITILAAALVAATAFAVVTPDDQDPLRQRELRHPDLWYENVFRSPAELPAGVSRQLGSELSRLGVDPGHAFFDLRTGRWGTLLVTQPLIPGSGVGNKLEWSGLGYEAPPQGEALERAIWEQFRGYLIEHAAELRIDPQELAEPSVTVIGERLAYIHVGRTIDGIAVRGAFVTAAINSGNLVLFGERDWASMEVNTAPTLSAAQAEDVVRGHVESFPFASLREEPRLELIPTSSQPEEAATLLGSGLEYRLAWVLTPDFEGHMGSWEALVDAHSGELLSFVDTNHYASRRVEGWVYPVSNDGNPPDGVMQPGFPMPFADIALDGTDVGFATTGGNAPTGSDAGVMATELSGRYIRMSDQCGVIDESVGAGDLDLEGVPFPGTDCEVPPGHSPGDTNASRTGFYELNRLAEQGRGYLPDNVWLDQQLTAVMNIPQVCNANWNGSTVNFFRSAIPQGCRNTGEIAGVFDHEWGHGMDDNDGNGFVSNPGEGIADIFAHNRLNTSCIGRGFFIDSQCNGYGDPCLDCTGIRDIDWEKRVSGQPHDIDWINANCGGGPAPCGGIVHCEGAVYSEAEYDLVHRDLQGFEGSPWNLDPNTALEIGTRLSFYGSSNVGNWYQCTNDGTGGCNADGGYLGFLAADDDNGDITDGTPHMTAIFAAFERHQISCNAPAVVDSGCAGGPADAPANVTATTFDEGAELSWDAVTGATEYWIFRTEGVHGCDFGKALVGTTTDTTFTETGLRNAFELFYSVVAVGASDACTSPMSECLSVIPTSGPSGFIEGTVIDADTLAPIAGAAVDAVGPVTVGDETAADGTYSILAPIGTYDVTADAEDYDPQTVTGVEVTEGGTQVVDFQLTLTPVPIADISPDSFSFAVQQGDTGSDTLNIGNLGALDLVWSIAEDDAPAPAQPQPLLLEEWSDNFDSYDTGSQLHGQGGWKGWLNDPAAGALVSDAQAQSTPNSAEIVGASDLVHEYVDSDSGQWIYTAWQFIPTDFSGTSMFIMLNTYNDGGSGLNWSTQVEFRGAEELVFNAGASGGTLPLIRGQWVELRVEIDLEADAQDFFYNGELLYSGTWTQEVSGGGQLNIGVVDLFANAASPVYYDDMSLTDVTVAPACTEPNDVPWLAVNPESGTTPPDSVVPVDVTVDTTGLDPGELTANLCVTTNDPDAELVQIPVALEVLPAGGPVADVSPDSFTFTLEEGGSDNDTLNLGNIGGQDLTWNIDEAESELLPVIVPEGAPYRYDLAEIPAFNAPVGGSRAVPVTRARGEAPADRVVLPAPQPMAIGDFSEGFDDITTLPGAGWALINNSEPVGPSSWFQGNETIFPAHEGEPDAYIAANFDSTADNGTISNWLITPEVTIVNGTTITFWTRKAELFGEFADRMEVRMSVEGASTDVGDTADSVGVFTEVLLTINPDLIPGEYPQEWTQFTLTVRERSREPVTGRFAFRYWVTDSGPDGTNGDYIGIDTVSVTQEVPPPGGGCDNPVDIPWLAVNPTSGTTPPVDSVPADVNVSAAGLDVGVYTAQLCVNTNDPAAPQIVVPVTLNVVECEFACLEYTPASIEADMEPGDMVTTPVTVTNPGAIPLEFSVAFRDFERPAAQALNISLPRSDGNFPRGASAPSALAAPGDGQPVAGVRPEQPLDLEGLLGTTAYAVNNAFNYYTIFDVDVPEVLPNIAPFNPGTFVGAGELVDGSMYFTDSAVAPTLYQLDPATGAELGSVAITPAPPSGQNITGLALDPTSGVVYATTCNITTSDLYTLDVASGEMSLIGQVSNSPCTIGIAIDGSGTLYGYDLVNDSLLSIDKSTAEGTIIGSLGFDANFGQGMAWDPATDTLLLAAFNAGTFQPELRAADRSTGNTTLIGVLGQTDPGGTNQLGQMAIELSTGVQWASADPDSGTVGPGESFTFDVIFDASELIQEGTYTANMRFSGNFSNDPPDMPLTLNLTCPSCGTLAGAITDSVTGDPVEATVTVVGDGGFTASQTGETYTITAPADTYTITAEADGYFPQTVEGVVLGAGETVTTDFALVLMFAELEYTPASIEEDMEAGDVVTNPVMVTNNGTIPLEFSVSIGGYEYPEATELVRVTVPAGASGAPEGTAAAGVGSPLPARPAYTYTDPNGSMPFQTSILIAAADDGQGEPLRSTLLDYPDIETVDVWDARAGFDGVPPLSVLETYPVVITWSNFPYADSTAMGDVLADYVDGGGLVIQATFNWFDPGTTFGLGGRFVTDGYSPLITLNQGNHFLVANLGSFDAGHPIMAGVTAASDLFRDWVDLDPEAELVASWDDDEEFIATKGSVVAINSYPGISGQSSGDIGIIFHNSVNFLLTGQGVQWASADPESGVVDPGETFTFDVTFDATELVQEGTYTAELNFSGNFNNDVPTMPLTMNLTCPTCGTLTGAITDSVTGDPVEATVTVVGDGGFTASAEGETYSITAPADTYTITAEADGYFPQTVEGVVLGAGETVTTDFALVLMFAELEYTPASIAADMEPGDVVTTPVTVTNNGTIPLEYSVAFRDFEEPSAQPLNISLPRSDGRFPRGESAPSALAAPGDGQPVAGISREEPMGPSSLLGTTAYAVNNAVNVYTIFDVDVPEVLPNIAPFNPGTFVGAGELVDGSVYFTDSAPAPTLYQLDPATGAELSSIPVTPAPPAGQNITGLALDPTSGVVYMTTCNITTSDLYTLDVASGEATLIGPVTNSPCSIGIAIDGSGTLYSYDLVNDSLVSIDKSTGEGTIIGSLGFDANFGQGMAWDPATDALLLAAFNAGTFQPELRAADRATGNTTLIGVLGQTDPGGTNQLGQMAIELSTGVQWASADPDSGTVDPGGSFTFDVIFDAAELIQEGTYTANMRFSGNFSNDPPDMPLTLNLTCPTCGTLDGAITDATTGDPVEATVTVVGDGGFTASVTGETYSITAPADTYTITAEADGYFPQTVEGVVLGAGETVTTDFALVAMIAILEYTPASIEETLPPDGTATNTVTVNNTGTIPFDFSVNFRNFEGPTASRRLDISLPASDGRFPRSDAAPSALAAPRDGLPVAGASSEEPMDPSALLGTTAYAINNAFNFYTIFDVDVPEVLPNIALFNPGTFVGACEIVDGSLYCIDSTAAPTLYELDLVTGEVLSSVPITPPPPAGQNFTGLALDPTSGEVYASTCNITTSDLYTLDVSSGAVTLIGMVTNSPCSIGIAIDGSGTLYSYDLVNDSLLSIDKSTAEGTIIGSLGFDANFGQGMAWDPATDTLLLCAFNAGTFQAELRTADPSTGNTTLVGVLGQTDPGGTNQLGQCAIELSTTPPWATAVPDSGTVEPGGEFAFDVIFDAAVTEEGPGTYTADLEFNGNFSNDPPPMPLTMTVTE